MSEQSSSSSIPNGTTKREGSEIQRLSSFKSPRDLTLGGTKAPKKVFTPNLNAVRNKNKSILPGLTNNKKEIEKLKRDRNKNVKLGPNIIKSSGVFSEGIAASERQLTRSSYVRDADSTAQLQKPVIRVKEPWKIDKELEEQNIKQVVGDIVEEDDIPIDLKDTPIKLPISAGGNMYSGNIKEPVKQSILKMEIKDEHSETDIPVEEKPLPVIPQVEQNLYAFEPSVTSIMKSEKPKIMLLQLPDNLPGRGPDEDSRLRNKTQDDSSPVSDNRCLLSELEEGRIGKILIHKSGKVKMQLGDTTFDISSGTLPCFRQDVVSISTEIETKSGVMINLGGIDNKLTVIPDWESLFKDVVI